jgi:hypothetical protein
MDLQISVDAESLTRRVAELIDTGRIGAARPLLAAARRMAPPSPRLAELSALLALRRSMPGYTNTGPTYATNWATMSARHRMPPRR